MPLESMFTYSVSTNSSGDEKIGVKLRTVMVAQLQGVLFQCCTNCQPNMSWGSLSLRVEEKYKLQHVFRQPGDGRKRRQRMLLFTQLCTCQDD